MDDDFTFVPNTAEAIPLRHHPDLPPAPATPPATCARRWSDEIRPLDKAGCNNDGYSMAIETKVRKIGNSLGIVLPKEALQALKVQEGDVLYLTEALECSLRVTPEKPGFQDIMKIAEEGMNRYRNALRELAK